MKQYRDEQWLKNQIGLGKDKKAIASECGVTVPTIHRWMEKFNIEKVKVPNELPVEKPRGDVIQVTGPDVRSRLLKMMNLARRDYTVAELRRAAKFPMISAIINTIVREVSSHKLVIEDKEAGESEAKTQLERVLAKPNKYDRGLRIFFDTFMRDLLIVGWANVEALRDKRGQARIEASEAQQFLERKMSPSDFARWIKKARKKPGAILGFICRDAGRIWMDALKGFYDVGDVDLLPTTLTPARKKKLTFWPPEKMARFFFAGTTETDKRLMPLGPTAQAYPIIDILYAVLVLLRERVDTPGWGKLVSFYAGKEAQGIHQDQFNTLVEALREDISSGTLPVVRAPIRAFVDDIGAGLEAEKLMLLIMDEYELIMWQIFGAGLVQMGRMEGQGRQMGAQQMEAAEKQAIGHMRQILRDDFVEGFVIQDPWSLYQNLTSRWVDTTAIPSPMEMFTTVWLPLIKEAGLPIAAVLEFFPEMLAVLQDLDIDPKELQNPAIVAAMIKAAAAPAPVRTESRAEDRAAEVLLKAAEILRAQESRPVHYHMPEMPPQDVEK